MAFGGHSENSVGNPRDGGVPLLRLLLRGKVGHGRHHPPAGSTDGYPLPSLPLSVAHKSQAQAPTPVLEGVKSVVAQSLEDHSRVIHSPPIPRKHCMILRPATATASRSSSRENA